MNEPKISIVTPMYNCEEYIVDCINSVLYQNFKDIEHIIIDDCSTDKSAEIASNIIEQHRGGEINFKLLRHEKNTGQGEAINDGIAVARGKYIRVLHADDVFVPNALDSLYSIAEKYDVDLIDVTQKAGIDLEKYDRIGFASGIYYSSFAKQILEDRPE